MTGCPGLWGFRTSSLGYYQGVFATREQAIEAAMFAGHDKFWIGQYMEPVPPENYLHGSLLIDHILTQDQYSHDGAEDCFDCTPEQEAELTADLRECFAAWRQRHQIPIAFGLIDLSTVERHDYRKNR